MCDRHSNNLWIGKKNNPFTAVILLLIITNHEQYPLTEHRKNLGSQQYMVGLLGGIQQQKLAHERSKSKMVDMGWGGVGVVVYNQNH